MSLVMHPQTQAAMQRFQEKPPHAILLLAPTGAGKHTLAIYLAARLLGVDEAAIAQHPYVKHIVPPAGKRIAVETVRELGHFLSLKPPGNRPVNRIIMIEQAEALTAQAQNALLKMIEEPPAGTVIILSASDEAALLPTVRSRVQQIAVLIPPLQELQAHFAANGYKPGAIARALSMSGGLPGLASAILADDQQHPLVQAAANARALLQASPFERLIQLDDQAKDKRGFLDTLYMLERMAHLGLENPRSSPAALRKWFAILQAAEASYTYVNQGAQPKLAALALALDL